MSYHSAAIFGLALLGVALGTAAVRAARTGGWRWLLSAVVVALVGAGGAWPFFSDRAMGTGEAFNYHLAVADANAQLRAGEFPALVGQTEFAYNGRVHPLRTAPYFAVLAGFVDTLSGRERNAWFAQNLALAFSLMLAAAVTYATLRWATRCPRPWAVALAACYSLGPPLLAAAYGMDLYMTVHVAPFVPLALGAAVRPAITRAGWSDVVLGLALGAAWWAHPPVGLWTTTCAGALRLVAAWGRWRWRDWGWLVAGGLLGLGLAAFPFSSALSLKQVAAAVNEVDRESYVSATLANLRDTLPASLLPVSRSGDRLGDFQLGYPGWMLLLAATVAISARAPGRRLAHPRRRMVVALVGVVTVLLVLVVPMPLLSSTLWRLLPGVYGQLTNIWPMQRLYLPVLAALVLAVGLAHPRLVRLTQRSAAFGPLLALILLGALTVWQAWPFVRRGLAVRQTAEETTRGDLATRRDITVTSYAMLGVPPTYTPGVAEPWAEYRVLRRGREVAAANLAAAIAQGHVAGAGVWPVPRPIPGAKPAPSPKLRLEPGQRYVLTFSWVEPPAPGLIVISGPTTYREYRLPNTAGLAGFGTSPGQRSGIAITGTGPFAEELEIRYLTERKDAPPARATYTLHAVDSTQLPVLERGDLPLRLRVYAPDSDCYVETPRRFIPGYTATVGGHDVRPLASPDGNVMVPVSAGASEVTLCYRAPSEIVWAFRLSALAAGGALLLGVIVLVSLAAGRRLRVALATPVPVVAGFGAVVLAFAVVASARRAPPSRIAPLVGPPAGPVLLELELPRDRIGRAEPLLAGGKPGAGNIVFLEYTDADHIRIGVEIWGTVLRSEPVLADYFAPHRLAVSAGMLHPLTLPEIAALPAWQRRALRNELRIEWDGRTVLATDRETFDADPASITVGASRLANSTSEPAFTGRIVRATRLPLPAAALWFDPPLALAGVFPEKPADTCEPLLAIERPDGLPEVFTVSYLPAGSASVGFVASGRPALQSPPVPLPPDGRFDFEIRPEPAGGHAALLNGRRVLELPPEALTRTRPRLARIGLGAPTAAGVSARFTGPRLALAPSAQPPASPHPTALAGGAVRLIVSLPTDRMGLAEPLLSTGVTGRGDLVYIKYVDGQHVRFGFDHWGVGGGESAPIPCDYRELHVIELVNGALRGDPEGPAPLEIRLDGAPVWQLDAPTYATRPTDIAVGDNRIGSSSSQAKFTGQIYAVTPAPAPPSKNRIAKPPASPPPSPP